MLCCSGAGSNDDVVHDEVTKLVETVKGQIVGAGDAQMDRSVEQYDTEVLGGINEGGELTNNEFLILNKLSGAMRVHE